MRKCAFSHIWGGRWAHMTLQPLPSGFPYKWGKFCFLFYQCILLQYIARHFKITADYLKAAIWGRETQRKQSSPFWQKQLLRAGFSWRHFTENFWLKTAHNTCQKGDKFSLSKEIFLVESNHMVKKWRLAREEGIGPLQKKYTDSR